jgi:oligopeptide/dipeptide ABC transporter ATP-binding protein
VILILYTFVEIAICGWALTLEVRNMPTAVYDGDRSAESRALINAFARLDSFALVERVDSPATIDRLMDEGRVQFALVIPASFSRNLNAGTPTEVQLLLDGSNSSIAGQALADVQIPNPMERLGEYPHHFSGGMRQRVVIAMALMTHPSLLIADEPTTALDVTTQAQVLDLMLRLAQDTGTAVMLITHDLGVVAGFCETVQVMYAGRIAERSPAREIYRDPKHPYTKGLLGSITRLDDDLEGPLTSIAGSPPALVDPPSGCRFWPRCPAAVTLCTEVTPTLDPIAPGRTVACHLFSDATLSKGAS